MKISTGFKSIDNHIGLLETKKMIMVAGRPGMGKTILLMNIGARSSINNRVLFLSLETSMKSLEKKFSSSNMTICDDGSISLDRLKELIIENKTELLIIDYIQLIADEYKKALPELKKMADELDVCILISSQLRRELEYREVTKRKPEIEDVQRTFNEDQLKLIDNIIYIYRDNYYNKDSDTKSIEVWTNTGKADLSFGEKYGELLE